MRREYKLAAGSSGRSPLEIFERVGADRRVIAVVPDYCAVDVLEAISRAYQDGREDRAEEDERRRYGNAQPPLLTSLDSDDYNGPWRPITDVAMVCTSCRTPVLRILGGWYHVLQDAPRRCGQAGPVTAMVAAGNENEPCQ